MTISTFTDGSTIETDNGVTAISGGQAMDFYNLMWLKSALPLEMRTGMIMSRHQTALDVARHIAGKRFSNRKQALVWLNEVLVSMGYEAVTI